MPSKIIFAGAVQNAERYLSAVFQNIENLSKLFYEVGYVFIENDSADNTKQIMKNLGSNKSNFHLISLDDLKEIPIRTVRLEIIRNAYIETIRHHAELRDFDYLAVLDMDDAGMHLIDVQEASSAIDFLTA